MKAGVHASHDADPVMQEEPHDAHEFSLFRWVFGALKHLADPADIAPVVPR
jgi:hypothetical protein